jgi:hypothetical protein
MSTVYIQKERVDHVVLNNDTGAALEQYEFTVIGGLAGVADEDIASAAEGSLHVEEGLILQAEDFVAAEDTFATVNQDVFWKPTTGEFSDTSTIGYYKVGILKTIKNSNGVILFVKQRHAELIS